MNTSQIGKTLAFETLKYCAKEGPTVALGDIFKYLSDVIVPKLGGLPDYAVSYDGHADPKWMTILKFQLVDFDKAGWFKKSFPKRGYWTITPEGIKALSKYKDIEVLYKAANAKYHEWLRQQKEKLDDKESELSESGEVQRAGVDDVIEAADLAIKKHLATIDPYQFQDLVAALFEAMGYFVDFVAPKGKDGGVDLVCYQDPMGIKAPRMKVQIKHRPDMQISRPMLSEFADVIKSKDEVGIYVTSGTYSRDARAHAIAHEKHIRLIDGVEFIDLYKAHYEKLNDSATELLPLIKVFHLKSEI